MLHNGDASTQDPVFLPPMFLFFRLRLSNDHGLRNVHLRVAAAVPLCHLHLVYRLQSPPGFPPQVLSSCIPPSLPPGQGRCTTGGQRTLRITAAIPESREVGGYQLSDLRHHASAQSYTDLTLCQSQTHLPSLLAARTLICDCDTLRNEERERYLQCIPYASNTLSVYSGLGRGHAEGAVARMMLDKNKR